MRTAILQVLMNVIDHKMDINLAVQNPRIHYENDLLSIENGFEQNEINTLLDHYPKHKLWDQKKDHNNNNRNSKTSNEHRISDSTLDFFFHSFCFL